MKKLVFGMCVALSISMVQTTAFASVNYAKETTTTEENDFLVEAIKEELGDK